MKKTTSHRFSAALVPLIAVGMVLSACGGSEGDAASKPTVTLEAGETSYATLPVVAGSTTIPAPGDSAAPATGEVAGEGAETGGGAASQTYEIKANDNLSAIATSFGVSLDALVDANGWSSSGEAVFPGQTIKIPAGGTAPASTAAEATPPADATTTTTTAAPETPAATVAPVGDGCSEGSYTIEAGDTTRFKVAEKFDVTVDAMDAANASTNGYSAFYPGLKIVIPAKDC